MPKPSLTGFVGRASSAIDAERRRKAALADIIARGSEPPRITYQRPGTASSQSVPLREDVSNLPQASEFDVNIPSTREPSTGDRYKSTLAAIDKLAQSAMKEGDNYTISRLSVLREKINRSIETDIDHDYMPEVWETGAIHSKNIRTFEREEGLLGIDELTTPEYDESYLKTRPYVIDGNPITYAQITKLLDKTKANLGILQGIGRLKEGVMYPLNPNLHQRLIAEHLESGMKEEEALMGTVDEIVKEQSGNWARFNNDLNVTHDRYNQLLTELNRADDDDDEFFRTPNLDLSHEQADWMSSIRSGDPETIEFVNGAIEGKDPRYLQIIKELGLDLDELIKAMESQSETKEEE